MKKVTALPLILLASVALVACGSSSSSSSSSTASSPETSAATTGAGKAASGSAQTLKVEANPNGQLSYVPSKLTAKPGNLTIEFTNPQGLAHDITVENSSGKKLGESEQIMESSTTLVLTNMKPGTYHYFCSVPGHREAGMEGTLTVK
jgi:plastocyanin